MYACVITAANDIKRERRGGDEQVSGPSVMQSKCHTVSHRASVTKCESEQVSQSVKQSKCHKVSHRASVTECDTGGPSEE